MIYYEENKHDISFLIEKKLDSVNHYRLFTNNIKKIFLRKIKISK